MSLSVRNQLRLSGCCEVQCTAPHCIWLDAYRDPARAAAAISMAAAPECGCGRHDWAVCADSHICLDLLRRT